MNLRAITAVYSYYFPEVRALIDDIVRDYPHDVFLRSISPGLDDFHEPVLEQLVRYRALDVPALGAFAYRYPTSGSEEGIREYLSLLAQQGVREIAMWSGDYEGYREVARSRGIATREWAFEDDPRGHAPTHFFVSNPSARDGNVIPDEKIRAVCDAGHAVFYDLSYLGATDPQTFDVSHPQIAAVACSFSKPYGLFYYRIGFLFTRAAVPALYANRWFKNIFSLLIAARLMDTIAPHALVTRYRPIQRDILAQIERETGLALKPSDALLLAHLPANAQMKDTERDALQRFRRGTGHRFCLTPYFLERAGR
ncbi:MAG: hypothetical protein MUF51_05360 [Vicinamibacteria bacterium]|jgi:histidinol-phosphate/aromatic aminotransferase/cobyric acid decarboxylase-like protein|nr:hypothetical protein [Vicinamibacteria bacterium]